MVASTDRKLFQTGYNGGPGEPALPEASSERGPGLAPLPSRPSWLRLYSIARRGLSGFRRAGPNLQVPDGTDFQQEVGTQQRAGQSRTNVEFLKQIAASPSLQPFIASFRAIQSGEPQDPVVVWFVCRCLAPIAMLLLLWTSVTQMVSTTNCKLFVNSALSF
jgi:hypothetical protein